MSGHRIIRCSVCRERHQHGAHGWCKTCYNRWLRRGRPADGPPKPIEQDPRLPTGRERHYSKVSTQWSDDQADVAKLAVLAGRNVQERRLLLEALGLVAHDEEKGR